MRGRERTSGTGGCWFGDVRQCRELGVMVLTGPGDSRSPGNTTVIAVVQSAARVEDTAATTQQHGLRRGVRSQVAASEAVRVLVWLVS